MRKFNQKGYIYIILLIGFCSIYSCNSSKQKDEKKFIYELPSPHGHDSLDFYYKMKCSFTEQLSLSPLEEGVDSFELRIWSNIAIGDLTSLLTIKKVDNSWQCIQYLFWRHSKPFTHIDSLKYIIDSAKVYAKSPLEGWDVFIDSIKSEGILTLPSQDDIKDLRGGVSDGIIYFIEYATPNKYKFYTYNSPWAYKESKECIQMEKIINICSRNFGGMFH